MANLEDIRRGSVGKQKQQGANFILPNLSVRTFHLFDLSVEEDKIAPDAVTTTKILNSTVTPAKLSIPLDLQVMSWGVPGAPTTGDNQSWIRIPFAHSVTAVYVFAKTFGTTITTVDIYRATQTSVNGSGAIAWTSIFSTAPTLAINERTNITTPGTISLASGLANSHYKMEVTGVGTGVADLVIEMEFRMV